MNFENQLDKITQAFEDQFAELNEAQLNWKPDYSTWSIAQNLDHLIVINESYYPIFSKIKIGNFKPPLIGRLGFLVNLIGNSILKSVKPENEKKTKTFGIWEPSQSKIKDDILERFLLHQEELKEQISSLDKYIKSDVAIYSPANKNIPYTLSKAIEIILAHELRHLQQARQIQKNDNW